MHFEVLAEDKSLMTLLDSVMSQILQDFPGQHTFRALSFAGKNDLLKKLPGIMRAYGKSLRDFPAAVIVVMDLDDEDCREQKKDLIGLLQGCNPQPAALFRFAIEESEAWLLGDRAAVKAAYPRARDRALNRYQQDSICGTWEKLADSIYPGGSAALARLGYPQIGQVKCEWAEKIAPLLKIDRNASKSFQVFRDGVRRLAASPGELSG